jgi:hypothetical protein
VLDLLSVCAQAAVEAEVLVDTDDSAGREEQGHDWFLAAYLCFRLA